MKRSKWIRKGGCLLLAAAVIASPAGSSLALADVSHGVHAKVFADGYADISAGDAITVEIEEEGDIVYYSFTPEEDGYYTFYTEGDADTYAYLYDADWELLTDDDDSGENYNASIVWECEAGTTYYIGFGFYSSSDTGTILAYVAEGELYFDDDYSYYEDWMDADALSALPLGETTLETESTYYYKYVPDESGYYTFALESDSYADGYLAIYDSSYNYYCGVWLETDYTAGTAYLESGETYYLVIYLYESDDESCVLDFEKAETSGTIDSISWEVEDSTLTISGSGAIPDFEGDAPWYYCGETIEDVVIESGVTAIGDYAFYDFYNMQSVSIPSTVTSIGEWAFGYCMSLTDVTIPSGVTEIEDYTFYYCIGLESLTIPSAVTRIGDYAFYYCGGLTSLSIPSSITYIGDYAFANCYSVTSVSGPDASCETGYGIFYGCDGMADDEGFVIVSNVLYSYSGEETDVTIPSGVTKIDADAFYYDEDLLSVSLPSSVTVIEDYAFCECYSLTSVTLSENLTRIGRYAFAFDMEITSISLPSSLNTLGYGAFYYCSSLESIAVPSGVTALKGYTFAYCTNLASISLSSGLKRISEGALYYCPELTSLTIPASVTLIDDAAFAYDDALTDVTFEGSAPEIGDDIFYEDELTAYYPADSTWTADLRRQYGGKVTWISYEAATEDTGSGSSGSGSSGSSSSGSSGQTAGTAKQDQTIKVKASARKKTIKAKKLKKKNQTFTIKATTSGDGKLTYSKVKWKKDKTGNKVKVSKNGKVTVKKGLKAGTYTIKVKIKASGTSSYNAQSVTKKVKITVK